MARKKLQDHALIQGVVKDYALSCNFQTFIVNKKGVPQPLETFSCPFLKMKLPECRECHQSFAYGCMQADHFGGKFSFFCPAGFIFISSPIVLKDKLEGGIIAGPARMSYNSSLMKQHWEEIEKNVPYVSAEKVYALSATLYFHVIGMIGLREIASPTDKFTTEHLIRKFKTLLTNREYMIYLPKLREKELMNYIVNDKRQQAESVLRKMLEFMYFSSEGHFKTIRLRFLEVLYLISRIAVINNAAPEQIFGVNFCALDELKDIEDGEHLQVWIEDIIKHFFDCVFSMNQVKHVDIIYKAIQYVQKNYNKKIYLEDVAAMIYLNPSYFSRVFKEEMGVTFNSYITNYRIEMSKNLLMDESIPILSVATLVGFDDQSYFTKVFKRKIGMTPKAYRNQR